MIPGPIAGQDAKIKVLVVDDSAIVRKIISEAIDSQPDMEVVGTAPDPYVARDKILALKPDVLTLDIEMPRMDGLTFLRKVMLHHPVPTIIISSLSQASTQAAVDALRYGAVEVLGKPAGPYSVGELRNSLATRIRAAAKSRVSVRPVPPPAAIAAAVAATAATATAAVAAKPFASVPAASPMPAAGSYPYTPVTQESPNPGQIAPFPFHSEAVLAIGASTGGTVAIQDILQRFPADMPCTVITQHIPAGFSLAFAKRLNQLCAMEVREAVNGDVLRRGLVLIAPGDYHMLLRRDPAGYRIELTQGPQVCYQRPAVDVMFASVAQAAGKYAVGVILTGMGTDGAKGLLTMKRAGAPTIGQDEASSVVYGMPREAFRLGAVDTVAPLGDIAGVIGTTFRRQAAPGRIQFSTPPEVQNLSHKGVMQ